VVAPGHVEIVERTLAAFSRRDLDAMLAESDPDIEVRPAVLGGLDGTVYRGHAGLRDFVADLDAAWREFRVEPEEFRDLGDTVLMLGRTLARGMRSGVELDTPSAYLFGLRDGKVHTIRTFTSPQDGLAAVGLSE
jgi:ketosteroid isomerase-like protein